MMNRMMAECRAAGLSARTRSGITDDPALPPLLPKRYFCPDWQRTGGAS